MTYDHYQQLRSQAENQIARRMGDLQPRSGNNVSVFGDGIAVEPIIRDDPEIAPPTWELVIYARVRYNGFGVSPNTDWFPYASAAGVFRFGNIFWQNFYWEVTQFFHITDVDPGEDVYGRDLRIEFQVRSVPTREAIATTSFEDAIYRIPVRISLDVIVDSTREVIKSTFLDIRRNGATRIFTPPEDNIIYRLQPTGITRL